MIGLYKFANVEGDNAKRYAAITKSLDRDGIPWSVETKENGWVYLNAEGKAKPRRAPARACGVKLPPLSLAVIQKRLDGLLDRRIRATRDKWGHYGFNTEGRKSDKVFGRAIAGVIARVGMDSELKESDMAECGEYYHAGFRMTARGLIDSRKRCHSNSGTTYARAEWKPVRERYSVETILEIGYTAELLRLAKARESAKAEKADKKRAGAPAVIELAKAA